MGRFVIEGFGVGAGPTPVILQVSVTYTVPYDGAWAPITETVSRTSNSSGWSFARVFSLQKFPYETPPVASRTYCSLLSKLAIVARTRVPEATVEPQAIGAFVAASVNETASVDASESLPIQRWPILSSSPQFTYSG